MIYSVWNHAVRRYDYYRTPETSAAVNAPTPKHLLGVGDDLGLAPEEAAWPLPANAVPAGSGKDPKGQVASRDSVGGRFFERPILLFGIGLALAWLWR